MFLVFPLIAALIVFMLGQLFELSVPQLCSIGLVLALIAAGLYAYGE